jgi:hypothetical protein
MVKGVKLISHTFFNPANKKGLLILNAHSIGDEKNDFFFGFHNFKHRIIKLFHILYRKNTEMNILLNKQGLFVGWLEEFFNNLCNMVMIKLIAFMR